MKLVILIFEDVINRMDIVSTILIMDGTSMIPKNIGGAMSFDKKKKNLSS